MTTGVFGVVVFLILAYLVVLLQVYGRRSCKFLFFSTFGLPPRSRFLVVLGGCRSPAWALPTRALISVCGLLFWWVPFLVARPSSFPARQGLTPLVGFPFFLSCSVAFFLFESWRNGLLGALWG